MIWLAKIRYNHNFYKFFWRWTNQIQFNSITSGARDQPDCKQILSFLPMNQHGSCLFKPKLKINHHVIMLYIADDDIYNLTLTQFTISDEYDSRLWSFMSLDTASNQVKPTNFVANSMSLKLRFTLFHRHRWHQFKLDSIRFVGR